MIRRDEEILRLDLRAPQGRIAPLSLADLESVRLVLRGGSPVDWHRLNLLSLADVDDLLRANLLDPDDPRDIRRLEYLHREAIRYLNRNFNFRFPPEVSRPQDVRDVFLYASEQGRFNRVQILSCVVLKVMHTINHLEARELLLETPTSEAELCQVVEQQVLHRARILTREGLPIVHFYGSRKTRDSLVNKLISKRTARASDILDKLRFRIVTETRDDIVPVLAFVLRHVFPWNQVTAGESTNNLLQFRRYLEHNPMLLAHMPALQVDIGIEDAEEEEIRNEFSGSTYQMINFIIDVPVRLDHLLSRSGEPWMLQKGSIVYVSCEFQVVDQETAYLNEQGENSHTNYKQRQREKVSTRLMWGLLNEGRAEKRIGRRHLRVAQRPKTLSAWERAAGAMEMAAQKLRPRRAPRPPRPEVPAGLGLGPEEPTLESVQALQRRSSPIEVMGPKKGEGLPANPKVSIHPDDSLIGHDPFVSAGPPDEGSDDLSRDA